MFDLEMLEQFMGVFFFFNNEYLVLLGWPIIVVIVGFIASRLLHRDILFNKYFLLVKIGTMMFFCSLELFYDNTYLGEPYFAGFAGLALMGLIRQLSLYFLAKEKKAWLADLICMFFEYFGSTLVSGELITTVGHASYSVNSILYFPQGLKCLGTAGLLFVNARPVQAIVAILTVYACGLIYFRLIDGRKDWYNRRFYLFKAALMVAFAMMIHDRDFHFIFRCLEFYSIRWTLFLALVIAARQLYIRFKMRRRELAAPDFVSALTEPVLIAFALRMFEVYVSFGGKTSCCF